MPEFVKSQPLVRSSAALHIKQTFGHLVNTYRMHALSLGASFECILAGWCLLLTDREVVVFKGAWPLSDFSPLAVVQYVYVAEGSVEPGAVPVWRSAFTKLQPCTGPRPYISRRGCFSRAHGRYRTCSEQVLAEMAPPSAGLVVCAYSIKQMQSEVRRVQRRRCRTLPVASEIARTLPDVVIKTATAEHRGAIRLCGSRPRNWTAST